MWIYTTSFITGYSALVWTFYWNRDSAEWAPGVALGCFLALVFMLVWTFVMQQVQLYKHRESEVMDLTDILLKTKKQTVDLKTVKRLRRFQKLLTLTGFLFLLLTLIPLLSVTRLADQESAASISLVLLVLLTILFGITLTDIKHRLRQFGPPLTAFCLACCWVMVILPLLCLVPTTLAVAHNTQSLQLISSWTIGFACILCMLGVSSLSILLNYIYKRLEYEKLAKYCCRRMQKLLRENGVWSRMPLLRQAFDHFYYSEESVFESVLSEATYITHRELTDTDKPLSCSKELLTVEELMKLMSGKSNTDVDLTPVRRNKHRKCSQWLVRLCSNKDQEEIPLDIDQLLTAEINGKGEIPEDNAEIQYEERDLVDQLAIYATVNPNRYRELIAEEEPVITQAEAKVQQETQARVDLSRYFGVLVQGGVRNVRDKGQGMDVKGLVERNKEVIMEKMMELEAGEPDIANEDLAVSHLSKKHRKYLLKSPHFESLYLDRDKRKEWFRLVYKRFAHGEPTRHREIWSTLTDLRQFVRIVTST